METATVRNRTQLKNILLATDFYNATSSAQTFAAEIAQLFGANLFVVHARTPDNYALRSPELWPVANVRVENLAEKLKENLHTKFPNAHSEVVVAEGAVWNVIDTMAEQKRADLIVVGTSGRSGIEKFFLGSDAEEIIRRAKCPVLAVGPHAQFAPRHDGIFKRIVHATDFGEGSRIAATYAIGWAQEHQAHLTLLHVIECRRTGELAHPHEVEEAALLSLRGLVPAEADFWCEPKTIVRHGEPAEQILEAAVRDRADLIVIGLRGIKSIGRATHLTTVAHEVLAHATCPVLTVRP